MGNAVGTVVTARLTKDQRRVLAGIAAYHKTTESELVRKMVVSRILGH